MEIKDLVRQIESAVKVTLSVRFDAVYWTTDAGHWSASLPMFASGSKVRVTLSPDMGSVGSVQYTETEDSFQAALQMILKRATAHAKLFTDAASSVAGMLEGMKAEVPQ